MSEPALVLLAHGTGDAAGRHTWGRLLVRLRDRLPGVAVRLAYAGVCRPGLADVLPELPGPVVVVPTFLAAGFHVRVDVPDQLAAIGRDDVVLARTLGPDPALVDAAGDRLAEAGGDPAGGAVVLAVAGSSDPTAGEDTARAAALASGQVGAEVPVGTIAGGEPRVADVVATLRERGAGRVALMTWLLAPGAFRRRLDAVGADVVAEPLGEHPAVVETVVARYRAAVDGPGRAHGPVVAEVNG